VAYNRVYKFNSIKVCKIQERAASLIVARETTTKITALLKICKMWHQGYQEILVAKITSHQKVKKDIIRKWSIRVMQVTK